MHQMIEQIMDEYRFAKLAELQANSMETRLLHFVRLRFTDWTEAPTEEAKKKCVTRAARIVATIRAGRTPKPDDAEACEQMANMVLQTDEAKKPFSAMGRQHKRSAERLAERLPAWEHIKHVRGFGPWGLAVLVGEAGDLGAWAASATGRPSVRALYKRLGFAPNEAYPRGEKSTGRKIPRKTKGRIIGIIYDSLIKAQRCSGKAGSTACSTDEAHEPHAHGPYGQVYQDVKERKLAEGKTKNHAHQIARRATTKALIHDVWKAWHAQPLTFAGEGSHSSSESQEREDPLPGSPHDAPDEPLRVSEPALGRPSGASPAEQAHAL